MSQKIAGIEELVWLVNSLHSCEFQLHCLYLDEKQNVTTFFTSSDPVFLQKKQVSFGLGMDNAR